MRTMARLTRDTAEDVVVNCAGGRMLTSTATELRVRELEPLLSDEPPARGGENRGPSPLELVLCSLCACTNVSAARLERLAGLVGRYCPVDSLIRAAVDDYVVRWERI